jgi:hypothetical protein
VSLKLLLFDGEHHSLDFRFDNDFLDCGWLQCWAAEGREEIPSHYPMDWHQLENKQCSSLKRY